MNMEEYKERIMDILKPLSLSDEETAFWEQILNRAKPELLSLLFEEISVMAPDEIKFFTYINKKKREAIQANDEEKFEEVMAENLEHFKTVLLPKYMKEKHLYCLKKAEEAIN